MTLMFFFQQTEQEINETRTSITKLIQTGHPDGFQLEVKLNLLERRCEKLTELMDDHKSLLNSAVEFYQLCEQVLIVISFLNGLSSLLQ